MFSVATFTSRNSFGSFGQYILLLIKITACDLTDVRVWTEQLPTWVAYQKLAFRKKKVNSLNEKLCVLWRAAMHNAVPIVNAMTRCLSFYTTKTEC